MARSLRRVAGAQRRPPGEQSPQCVALIGLLNKTTPDNYDQLLAKMLAVGVDDGPTLDAMLHQVREPSDKGYHVTGKGRYSLRCAMLCVPNQVPDRRA